MFLRFRLLLIFVYLTRNKSEFSNFEYIVFLNDIFENSKWQCLSEVNKERLGLEIDSEKVEKSIFDKRKVENQSIVPILGKAIYCQKIQYVVEARAALTLKAECTAFQWMNKCFLNPEKNLAQIRLVFEKNTPLIPKNDVTEPKASYSNNQLQFKSHFHGFRKSWFLEA